MKKRKRERTSDGEIEATWDDLLREHGAAAGSWEDAAIVIFVASGRCRVVLGGDEIECLLSANLAVRQKSALAVGDRVVLEREAGMCRVAAVMPRRTVLARPDPLHQHRQRLIAANVDVVVHVVSVKSPPLRPRLIDRVLVAVQRGGAAALLCVNKVDLLDDAGRAAELAKLTMYEELGVPVIACSAQTGEGLDAMRAALEGKTSALVGHSGVGKSSILNALDARLALTTGEVRKRGSGRHTTTAATLYDFGDQTYLIDTPGIREFGLWDLDRESLRDYFPEFFEAAESCRFTDCSHVHEPDCEVKRRVADGRVREARYETYRRLYDDLGAA